MTSKIEFPWRDGESLEDFLIKERDQMFERHKKARYYVHTQSWNSVYKDQPYETPFYTSLNNKACIYTKLSRGAISEPNVIVDVINSGLPLMLHVKTYLAGPLPLLRCNLFFPDDPKNPLALESPLNIRGANAQDFIKAILAEDLVDIIFTHQDLLDEDQVIAVEYDAEGLGQLFEKETKIALENMKNDYSPALFDQSYDIMINEYRSSMDGIFKEYLVQLTALRQSENSIIKTLEKEEQS